MPPDSHRPHARPERAHHLGGGDAAGLDVGAQPDPPELPARAGLRAAGVEARVVRELQRPVEREGVVPGVVLQGDLGGIGEGVAGNEVAAPELRRVDAHLVRRPVDDALHHVGRLGAARATERVHRRGVGEHRLDLAVDGPGGVLALHQGPVEVGRHAARERGEVGAHVGQGRDPQAEEPPVRVEGQLHVALVVAPVRVRDERFGPVRGPLHRPPDPARRPQHGGFFLVDEDLRAEPAAHVRGDDVQLVLGRDLDERGEHQPVDVGVLAGQAQGIVAGGGVVVPDGGARLHRVGDEPVVHQIEPGHVVGAGECLVGGRAVPDLPVVAEVAGRLGVDLRRPVREGLAHGRHGRQRGVVHLHLLRRVARRARALRHHDRHRVPDVAHRVRREHRMGRRLVRLPVLAGHRPAADERALAVRREVRPGQHRHHPGRGSRGRGVEGERGVGMGRAHERGVRLARKVRVVGVIAGPGEEPVVFGAGHRCPDAVLSHVSSLRASRSRRRGWISRCCDNPCTGKGFLPATRAPRRRSGPDCGPRGPARS